MCKRNKQKEYFLPALLFPSIPFHFFPHFSKNRRVEGNSNFKSAISFHFYIDFRNYYLLPFWLLFPSILQNCYFLPLFLINKSISKSANLISLHLQNKSLFNYNSNLYAEGPNICLSCTKNGIFCPSYFVRALVIFVVHILLLNIQSFEWANNRNSLLFFCKCSNKSSIFKIFGKAICGNDVLDDT